MGQTLKRKETKLTAHDVGTQKHKIVFYDCEVKEINACSTMWSEGSRSQYYFLNMETKQRSPVDLSGLATSPFSGGALSKDVEIPDGHLLIEVGTFCGKPATPFIFGRAKDLI